MQSASEILEQLVNVPVTVKCRRCGAEPVFTGKQYTTRCPSCGGSITLTRSYLAHLKVVKYKDTHGGKLPKRIYNCQVCKDTGIVVLEEQIDNNMYEFGYKCFCPAGSRRDEAWPVVPVAKIPVRGGA